MISVPVKKLFRRCLLIALISVATGCASVKQMPSSPVEVQERSLSITTTAVPETLPLESSIVTQPVFEVPDKDLVLETPAQNSALVKYVSTRFKVSEKAAKDIIELASKYAYDTFPKRNDILALIAVESSFNPMAKSKGCLGLLQIEKASHKKLINGRNLHNPEVNIEVGSKVLNMYYGLTGSNKRGAVLSFNSGIGNYLKHRYKSEYYSKYSSQLNLISNR